MEEVVKRKIERNARAIQDNLNLILSDGLSEHDIKEVFNSIRILVDYTESLALNGVSAIEEIQ